jgi:hypothetical protein
MAKTANSQVNHPEVDPELERLKQKSAKGAMNVFGDVLNNPEIKKMVIKKATMPIIAVACLFVGVLELYDVTKQLLGINWQVQTIMGLILLTIGLSYILKNMSTGEKHDN